MTFLDPEGSSASSMKESLDDILVVVPESRPSEGVLIENIPSSPSDDPREDASEVFFDSVYTLEELDDEMEFVNEYPQLKLKKASKLPITLEEIEEEKKIKGIVNFFNCYPLIGLSNFKKAEELLTNYLNEPHKIEEKLIRLQEEIDKNSRSNSKFGKLVMTWSLRSSGSVRIKLHRCKLNDSKQDISINLSPSYGPALTVYTHWNWKNKKTELIRSKLKFKPKNHRDSNSIKFDAKVWQAFNNAGIKQKNFMKSLDCLERNYLDLPQLVHEINKKNLLNFMTDTLLNNVSIRTNSKDTTFLNFKTNTAQKVGAKMTSFASSLTIHH